MLLQYDLIKERQAKLIDKQNRGDQNIYTYFMIYIAFTYQLILISIAEMTQNTKKFCVKSMNGPSYSIDYSPTSTVQIVLNQIIKLTGLKQEQMVLIHAGSPISDKVNSTLEQVGIQQKANVFLIARLRGGSLNEENTV